MNGDAFRDIGSFAVVVVPVVGGAMWLVKVLFSWFTQSITAQTEQTSKLIENLVAVMRETHKAHEAMMEMLVEGRKASAEEHRQIMQMASRGNNS